jgi:hypothetical protein
MEEVINKCKIFEILFLNILGVFYPMKFIAWEGCRELKRWDSNLKQTINYATTRVVKLFVQ